MGHVVSQKKIYVDSAKIDAILQWKGPKNVVEIHSFLKLARYYQCFIEGFSRIIRPLMRLIRKEIKFEWDDSCESAFMEQKQRLTSALILTLLEC